MTAFFLVLHGKLGKGYKKGCKKMVLHGKLGKGYKKGCKKSTDDF